MRKLFSNRVLIVVGVALFIVWIMFFDTNSLVSLQKVNRQIEELETERQFYIDRIKEDSLVIIGLEDSAYIEAFAREHFYMIGDSEELYIIKPE